MSERKKKLSRVMRMECARKTVVILKTVKIPSWDGNIRWREPIMQKSRKSRGVTGQTRASAQPEAERCHAYTRNSKEASLIRERRGKRSQRR